MSKKNGRDRLISSALQLFSEKGFYAVSIREICDNARANQCLISYYFGGKENLLEVIFEERFVNQNFNKIVSPLISPESKIDFEIKLKIFLKFYVSFYLENKEVVSLYFEELENGHELANRIYNKTYGIVWDRLNIFLEEAQLKNFVKKECNLKIISLQTIGPIFSLIRTAKAGLYYAHCELIDELFLEELIQQIICSIKNQ